MGNQDKKDELIVSTDETGRPYIMVDRSRAEALKDYLAENGFSSTHIKDDDGDFLNLGNADPEEVQSLVDEWTG